MKIRDSLDGQIVTLELSGKIMGGDDATLFHGKIHEYLNLNKRLFIIDLEKTEWINSVGLGMLISGLASASTAGGRMALANITNVQDLLSMTRLLKVFETYDSHIEAKKSLQ